MTTTPATTEIDALKALEQAATPAPWAVLEGGYMVRDTSGTIVAEAYGPKDAADAAFIAAARNALPALLDELAKTRAELANATILLIEAVQHSGLPATTRQRINGLLAEANPATTAEPADEPKATCGHPYIGNEGEFTCDLYAPHPGKHWNSLAEFAWTDERAA